MADTKIEWAEKVWNPLTGCQMVSKACTHCYALRISARLEMMGKEPYQGVTERRHGNPRWTGKINLLPDKLFQPLHWKKPARIFVNSMSDLFHKNVPQAFSNQVFHTMKEASWHNYLILTKRFVRSYQDLVLQDAAPHIWIGFSLGTQEDAKRALHYLKVIHSMGWVTWISNEPALEPIDFSGYEFVDLIVTGGESGEGCRPFEWDWARQTCDWAVANGVKFFMKQGGGHPNKRNELEDLPEDLRIRQWPEIKEVEHYVE